MIEKNKIYLGNNLEILKTFPDNSIDSVVTDPPYGLGKEPNAIEVLQSWITTGYHEVKGKGFMGKEWDAFVPQPNFWKEVYRVLKPGGYVLSFAGTRTYDWMVMAVRLAGFEVRDMIAWLYGCLDETSEILTEEGFKKYNEIKKDDIVFSLNPNKKIVKNKVKHKFIYEVENETLSHIVNDNTDQLLTNNHKMLLREYVRKQENGIRNGNYETNYKYVDAVNRPMQYKLPLGAIYDGNYSIGKDFAELIGWVISEGHYQKDTNAVNLYQSSVNKEYVKRIKYLLGRLQIPYSEYQRKRTYKDRQYMEHQFYISGDYATKIKNIIPNKKLHYKLLDLPYGEKLRLIKGLVMGDGSLNGNIERSFYQSDLEQLQIFQILLHLSNKQGRINEDKMVVEIHHNPETEIQGKHKKQFINYTGKVWSIETEVGNYIAKRNGKIFITGNSGFPKSHDVSKAIDKHLGAERQVVGVDEEWIKKVGFSSKSNTYTVETFGSAKGKNAGKITIPTTDLAKQYEGWGTALKPALEPIVMARKPLAGTVAQNVLKHGVGGINIDGCRVPFGNETDNRVGTDIKRGDSKKYKYNDVDKESFNDYENDADLVWSEKTSNFRNIDDFYEFLEDWYFYKPKENLNLGFDIFDYEVIVIDNTDRKNVIPLLDTFILNSDSMFGQSKKGVQMYEQDGRFPANLIHDGSEEVVSLFPNTAPSKSGLRGLQHSGKHGGLAGEEGNLKEGTNTVRGIDDDGGSAARFFYTAKASKEERNFGLYDFEDVEVRGGGGRVEKGYDENNEEDVRLKESARKFGAVKTSKKNIHPTVKPIDLMRYLVRLVTPPNGICLDPYLGSGTTAIACKMEKFSWIGIELVPEYAEIAKARIGAVKDYETTLDTNTIIKESIKEDKEKELGIMDIFDFMEE